MMRFQIAKYASVVANECPGRVLDCLIRVAVLGLACGFLIGCSPRSTEQRPRIEAVGQEPSKPLAKGVEATRTSARGSSPHTGPIVLRDVTAETGITFKHTDGSSGKRYVVEQFSAGVALFDYDGDGAIDIYFLNGAPLRGTVCDTPPRNALYRNEGGWKFTDVTEEAGVGDTGYGLGVAAADYDNDGDLDLYVNNYGPNVLYRNNADGTFTDVTQEAAVADGNKVGAGVCFFDADNDCDLDLYVANYVKFSYDAYVPAFMGGVSVYPGPWKFEPEPDTFYRNNGDGTFTDVSVASGIANHAEPGMGTVCFDYDDDGDADVFVCNDGEANFLFQNDGTGVFQEVALLAGTAFNVDGGSTASMGCACGDFDNDGRLDLFETTFQHELPVFYRNLGDGLMEDATLQTGAGEGSLPHVNWGVAFVDFDNDANRDVFIACGHVNDLVEQIDDTAAYHARNVLLRNTGNGSFVNVSDRSGDGLLIKLCSRGTGFDDLDNDGDVDVVILNSRREPTLLRNDSPGGNHWLQIRLVGVKTNRDGVGARVRVVAGDLELIDDVHSGHGYQSHYGTRLYFGLGRRGLVDRIEVDWIGGGTEVVEDVPADQLVTIIEGEGLAAE